MNQSSTVLAALASRAKHARSQTALADAKAQTLASGLVPSIAAAIAAGAFAGVTGPAAVTGWIAAALAAAAVAFLGLVLWPRTSKRRGPSTPRQLLDVLAEASETEQLHLAATEALRLERIEAVKFAWLRAAMALTAAAGLLAATTVALAVSG
ncbi:hypothetical protein [Glycomyces artemisiae]|uniref:Pycsar effector protein domain-containing protein n=1 Tax=Glycomyces artemisiae TaxID=1076443 RepID=A0A2T0UXF1_9ACTN|nr:hypothetical protein [Glycomyces artemisiae]PRY62564.1 hypothetical protein B0I28_101898 [Glycomyces artemisiae]